jgi:hypothetical protein
VRNATIIASDHDLGLDDDVQDLDFVPFSTPGPGSLVSMENPRSKSPRLPAIPEDPRIIIDLDTALFPDSIPFSKPGPTSLVTTSMSSLLENTSSLRPSADPRLPSYIASLSDTVPGYSSDDIPYWNAHCDDPFADDSASDPSFDPANTQPLPDLFATPGPGYRSPQRIYFDSPTEDPSSDSLQPGYDIDYETLDFHWEPFNRKDTDVTERKETIPSIPLQHAGFGVYVDTEPDRQEIFQATKQEQLHPPPSHRPVSPSPFAFAAGSQSEAYTIVSSHESSAQQCQTTPEPQQMPPVFAPAPGIFLSPLRDGVLPNSLDGSPCATMPNHVRILRSYFDQ